MKTIPVGLFTFPFLALILAGSVSRGTDASATGLFSDTGFFPIAVWLQSPSNASAYKSAGINLFVGLWEGPDKEQLDKLKSAGMPVLCDQNEFALANLATYGDIIAGWMHMDEPDNAQSDGNGGYGPCISPDTVIARYNIWKSKDPGRPVYLNLGQGVSHIDYIGRGSDCHARTDMYPRYILGCDIASFDIYPVNSQYDVVRGNLWYVAKGIDSLRIWSDDRKETWCWIECTRIDSSSSTAPLPGQVKAEVWMALIHGAKGFGYFCHSWYGGFKEAAWLNDAQMKTAITAANARITALAPVLNSPTITGTVTVESSESSVPIDALVKYHAGSTYIFAVAMRGNPATGSFYIAGAGDTTAIEVLDENRTLTATGGKFRDSFEGYGVHLYKINLPEGIRVKRSAGTHSLRGTLRRITVMRGAAGSVSSLAGDAASGASVKVYTLQGKYLHTLPAITAGSANMPDGVYIVPAR